MTHAPAHAPPAKEPVVSVENLRVRFLMCEATVAAINGISFDLEAGQVLAILGESGSGKSVTLRALMRLLPPARTRMERQIRIALRALPEGFSFAPRCRHAQELCRDRMPPETTLSPERITRCLRVAGGEIDLGSPSLSERSVAKP